MSSTLLPSLPSPTNVNNDDCASSDRKYNRLSSLYPPIVSTIVGPYLTDIDAYHLARCSKQSLEQLQRRCFHTAVSVRRMLLLHPEVPSPFSDFETRSPNAFGRASAVLLSETNEDWTYLHKLPTSVRRVVLEANVTACLATDLLLGIPEYERKMNEELKKADGDPYQVSDRVLEVCIDGTVDTLNVPFPLRFCRMRFSRMQVLRFPSNAHTVLRACMGRMLHHLPDSLTELDLGNARAEDLALEGGSCWPMTSSWPTNLRTLKGYPTPDANPSKTLPLPPTLTHLDSNFTGELWSSDDLQTLLPTTLRALQRVNLPEFKAQQLKGEWVLPPSVTFLRLGKLHSSSFENSDGGGGGGSIVLPITLQTLRMPVFDAIHKLLPLPDSLTAMTFSSANSYADSLVHLSTQWPRQLRSLRFGLHFNTSLTKWIPPPNLEYLNLGGRGNLPLQEIPLPETLRVLKLGSKFHRSLIGVHFPLALEELEFGVRPFKEGEVLSGDKWNPPPKLKVLTMRTDLIDATTLPSTLEKLTLLASRPFRMHEFANNLQVVAASLLELDMTRASVQELTPLALVNALPQQLKVVRLPGRKQWSFAGSAWKTEVLVSAVPPASLCQASLRCDPKCRNEMWILRERLMMWAEAAFLPHCSLVFL